MPIDFTRYSAKELNALISQANRRKSLISKRKPVAVVRRKIEALAKQEGYMLVEIFGPSLSSGTRSTTTAPAKKAAKKTTGPKTTVAPKYRNPANADDTWTGRGKRPRWLAAELDKGRQLDEFLIG